MAPSKQMNLEDGLNKEANRVVGDDNIKKPVNTVVATKPATKEDQIKDLMVRVSPELKRALPAHLSVDRMTRIALTTIKNNSKLLECTTASLMGAVMTASVLGLEPGVLGMCHIIPYNGVAQFQMGYQGYIELNNRGGRVKRIFAKAVKVGDDFEYEFGINEKLRHKPLEDETKRGNISHFYAYAILDNGGVVFDVWSNAKVELHRERYSKDYVYKKKSGKLSSCVWHTNFEEMGCKTLLLAIEKYLPKSPEITKAILSDGRSINFDPDSRIIDDSLTPTADIFEGESEVISEETVKTDTNNLTPTAHHNN